ncbi:MAG: hypothetical protein IJE19_05105 [Clostridia bacterium]|nr:hypothetical protein [Clostridia bacterium]
MEHTEGKRLTKKIKILLTSAAALIMLVCLIVIGSQIIAGSRPENNSTLVYRSGGETVVRINGKERILSDFSADGFKYDEENERVFFTVASSRYDGLYDLCYIQKHRSELCEPKIIDVGVEHDFNLVSGKIYYLKRNTSAGANDGCVCDIDNSKIETFSANVEGIYALSGSERLYFTKMHGNNKVLYSYEDGIPREVCRDIVSVFSYNTTNKPHIIYERKSQINAGMTELYIAYSDSEPELICDNTYLVMFDDYSEGGNLYYYTSSSESISWSAVISDEFAESDKTVTKPVRDNFFAILGISAEYNEALRLYQDKLVRDEIRAALNESVEKGEFSAPVFTAFAYNEQGVFKVAEKIDPNNVYTVSDFGDPKIIFESTEISANQSDMATLVSIAQRSTMKEVIEYARSLLDESVKSNGMAFAGCSSDGSFSYALEGYDKKKTLFSFSESGSRIFAFVRDTNGERLSLYTNSINDKLMPSACVNVDNGLSSYRIVDDAVVYLKADTGKNTGDLYSYDGEKSMKLSNAATAFTAEKSGSIIVIKEHNLSDSQPTADYYILTGEEEQLVDTDISVSSFNITDGGKAAYITGAGSLKIFYQGKTAEISADADEIIMFK